MGKTNIIIILLKHISNFTDFNFLERNSTIHLFYSDDPTKILKADIIIPVSKNTISDLLDIRKTGTFSVIQEAHLKHFSLYGI